MMNVLPVIEACTAAQPSASSLVCGSRYHVNKLTGMDLVGDPANSVSNCLENHDTSKPAVHEVHGVERDTGELNDGVVASSEEE
jgi:hypothetical protein